MSRRLGQHFLRDARALKKIVSALALRNGDCVIEIGAGHGEITKLLSLLHPTCSVVAIEKDRALAEELQKRFSNDKFVEVVCGDVLHILPALARDKFKNKKSYKLIGNVPYYLTGRLVRIIGELAVRPQRCVFTLQEEVGERLAARPPRMNKLAASVQFWAHTSLVGSIPREKFIPPPRVDSVVVLLTLRKSTPQLRKDILLEEKYYRTVSALFKQPRKTILNNLAEGLCPKKPRAAKSWERAPLLPQHDTANKKSATPSTAFSKEELSKKLKDLGINPDDRPHNLDISDIVKLSGTLF